MKNYYMINPYSSIFKTSKEYIVNSSDEFIIKFPFSNKEGIDFILNKKKFTLDELSVFFTSSEKERLIRYHTVIPYIEKRTSDDFLSRQEGFFSLFSSEYSTYEERIKKNNVLLLGAGAIGTHVYWNLLSIGVKNITIVDYDIIEESNLNRQLFYDYEDLGSKKVDILLKKGQLKNREANIKIIDSRINTESQMFALVRDYDFIIKAIDTPDEISYWLNNACIKYKKPYIAGGFIDTRGIVGPIYIPGKSSCCLNCYTLDSTTQRVSSNQNGTIAPLTTIVASKMSMISMKIIIDDFLDPILNKNYTYDFITDEWSVEKQELIKERCETCGNLNKVIKKKNNLSPFLGSFVACLIAGAISFVSRSPFLLLGIPLYFTLYLLLTIKINNLKDISIFTFNYSSNFILCFLLISSLFNVSQLFPSLIFSNVITTISSLFIGGVIIQIILFWISILISIFRLKFTGGKI